MNILLTGITGFVGSAIARSLVDGGRCRLVAAVRSEMSDSIEGVPPVFVGDFDADNDWNAALADINVVIHAAAHVHQMGDGAALNADQYRRVNTEATLNLARQASERRVRRFIFISSIKVNGEYTSPGKPFTADDQPRPEGEYAISKWEAEKGLWKISNSTGMEVVVIRPPLVYGPGVKANFEQMFRWVYRGVPLPLGALTNKRSMVAIDNLVDLVLTCVTNPNAANHTFLVADGVNLSIAEVLQEIGEALGKSARLLPFPVLLLKIMAKLLGKSDVAQRLCGWLEVDIEKTKLQLDWSPTVLPKEGFRLVAHDFLKRAQHENTLQLRL